MKIFKSYYSVAAIAIAFASCKTVAKIPVPKGTNNVVTSIAKKTPVTEAQQKYWGHADLVTDTIPGMSIKKAYTFLKGKEGVPVIVGVIDSGIDLKHEDLKNVAWINPKEIANNGIDDDQNGFVDDVHGWNFLGPIYKENAEIERILRNPKLVNEEIYKEIKAAQDTKVRAAETTEKNFKQMLQAVEFADQTISEYLKKKTYTKEEVLAIKEEGLLMKQAIQIAEQMYGFGIISLEQAATDLQKEITKATSILDETHLNTNYRAVLNDNAQDFSTRGYGDGKIGHSEENEIHGTHVSGIIAAQRNNNIGMNGVAQNVKIMAIRAVPDGDEYDKDIALAIRYAVDNGAKVINASFGKSYSPNKKWVYDAIKYAAKKDVLIVHAAGNDGKNIDVKRNYPTDSDDLVKEIADNVLTIGATNFYYDEKLLASFSNYGKRNVDVFAPGVQIYATFPEDTYRSIAGTSMAAPAVSGVAALIRSYYPELSARQVKHIIMNSGTKIDFKVIKPGSLSVENPIGEKVLFSELSVSGRIVNAYNALKMSDSMLHGKNQQK